MKRFLRLTALVLTLCMLCGCGIRDIINLLVAGQDYGTVWPAVEDGLQYVRPDMDAHDRILEESCRIAKESESLDQVVDAIYTYYDIYDLIYAAYDISYLHYCANVTDTYWEQEYGYCAQVITDVDAGLEKLFFTLAQSPVRSQLETEEYFGEGYFDAYEGDNPREDPALIALLDQETALVDEYYSICADAEAVEYYSEAYFDRYGTQLGQVLVELIALRQQIAQYFGYDSYPEFAYDNYHYRDYTPAQAVTYLENIGEELLPLYLQVEASDIWEQGWKTSTETENFQYVKTCAEAMGGDVQEAFAHMEANRLYDIGWGDNKYRISYEVFILYYYQPFVFMCPEGTVYDKLTFAHEFGHFVNDYVCGGSYAGTDVAEVHSQAMEYLSLCYGQDTQSLERLKMADSLCTYMEQAAYALFEHRVYQLQGEELTVENVQALFSQIGTDFGFDSWDFDSREYVTVPHFFVQPMYVVSYVVSNDVAMQIYQLEKEKSGAGLAVYEKCIYSGESYLLTFAGDYGLQSPFVPGRLETVKKTFEGILG